MVKDISMDKYVVALEKMCKCINEMYSHNGLKYDNEICLAKSNDDSICSIVIRKQLKIMNNTLNAMVNDSNSLNLEEFVYNLNLEEFIYSRVYGM